MLSQQISSLGRLTTALANRHTSTVATRSLATVVESTSYTSPFRDIYHTIEENSTFLGSKEFTPPNIKLLKCGCPEHVLRFKTATYGRLLEAPFVKPMEHRITLQVETQYIPLNDLEQVVLKEVVGNRLDENTGVLQLSSSQFGSRIENKRHVVSMLERIVESTKDLAARVEAEAGEVPDSVTAA